MKKRILTVIGMLMVWATFAAAQQMVPAAKTDSPPAKTVGPAKTTSPARPAILRQKSATAVDPDFAYKANCSRCHLEPRKFSERKMATIMRHMQVRANLTEDEAAAILRYLTR